MTRSVSAIVLAALCALLAAGEPKAPGKLDYDAAFVRMAAPEKVTASAVFAVTITVRNTGTRTWEGSPIRLRTINPRNAMTWGTDYILIAQGTAVAPGDEYAFRSNLRAPAEPGPRNFRWQVCKDGTAWFGESTPARSIEVAPRPAEAPAATVAGERISGEKKTLRFGDFEYVGSFKAPRTVGNARGAFSESGLALRPMEGGRQRLLMNYTHPTQVLFEVEIPEPLRVVGGAHGGLKTAAVTKVWGPVTAPKSGEYTLRPNGGFTWIAERQTLLWTWYHGYKTGDPPPILGATRLTEDGGVTSFGPWYVSAPAGLYKSYWGGVIALPAAFAETYTGGKTLALGFGGYYSICGSASRGPALGSIPDPPAEETSVPVTAMLYHRHDSPALRDGDYFNANCGFWSEQPLGPDRGTWTYDDWCRAGVFMDTPNRHAYVAFVRLGTGRLGYDFGAITSAGVSEYWYFYDPVELGEAAAGTRQPWRINPRSRTKVTYPLGRTVTGACFDARARRLYLCVSWAYPVGMESYPVIHVYDVRDHPPASPAAGKE